MVLKYFLFLFFIVLMSIFAIINDDIGFGKLNFKISKFATLHFEEVTSFQIDSNGVKREIVAESITRYDTLDDIKKLDITIKKEDNSIQKLKADRAKYYKKKVQIDTDKFAQKEIYFDGNVVYIVDDNMTLKSQTMVYDLKDDIINCSSDFNITNGKNRVWGSGFRYEIKSKKIFATDIKSLVLLEDEK